jgi:hypothetical protein
MLTSVGTLGGSDSVIRAINDRSGDGRTLVLHNGAVDVFGPPNSGAASRLNFA